MMPPPASGKRILILHADAAQAEIIASNLRQEGHSVLAFSSPQQALEQIHEVDILMTEHRLPEMTGLEVAQRAYALGWRGSLFIKARNEGVGSVCSGCL